MFRILKRLYNYIRAQRIKYSIGTKFQIRTPKGVFFINTTFGHPLKIHLQSMRLHDRFLPYLVKNTASGCIDVGSNIGDTLVLIKSLSDCKVVCVDPVEDFNKILEKNIKENNFKGVRTYNFPISSRKFNVKIEKNSFSSSGNIIESDKGKTTKTINDLIQDLDLDLDDYRTIKVDTDGFDWDVLGAISDYCRSNSKNFDFIFYEHQTYLNNLGPTDTDCIWRENQYYNALMKLREFGFKTYYLFDNFGNFILKSDDLDCLYQISKYPRLCNSNRVTFNFCDVLIAKDTSIDVAEKTLTEYLDNSLVVN